MSSLFLSIIILEVVIMAHFWDAKEVAAEFFGGKQSYWTILKMAKAGDLPHIKQGKRYLFDPDTLAEWKRQRQELPHWMQ